MTIDRRNSGLGGLVLILALPAAPTVLAQVTEGTPAPSFLTTMDSTPAPRVLAYIQSLRFDQREGTTDKQALPLGDCPRNCRFGPLVEIQPEVHSHGNRHRDLRGSGRIIARVINHDRNQGYATFNLGPGDTVYWAVDRVRQVNRDVSRGRSHFISLARLRASSDSAVLSTTLVIDEHPGSPVYQHAVSRWRSDGPHAETWNVCKTGGCCHLFPPPGPFPSSGGVPQGAIFSPSVRTPPGDLH